MPVAPEIRTMPLADLEPAGYNPRRISDRAMAGLTASLRRFGLVQPIVWNARTRTVVGGHQRLAALAADGVAEAQVVVVDLPEGEERALNVALNSPALSGEFTDGLGDILDGIAAELPDLYEALLLDDLREPEEPAEPAPDDDPPEVQAGVADSVPGRVYELGPHRVVCGDCRDADVWDGLLDGQGRPALVLTDPPYGVGVDYDTHHDSEAALRLLAQEWLPVARERSPVVVFTPGITRQWLYPEPAWVMCWFYGGGQHRSPWGFNCWQPILCYGKDPSLAAGRGARPDAVNLNTPANAADIDHPCPKPLPLWRWIIERTTFGEDDLVVDPFLGSGTTLIAAAETGRICRGIEISPAYVDVVRRRWTMYAAEVGIDPGSGALDL